jgi:hypothetical protein
MQRNRSQTNSQYAVNSPFPHPSPHLLVPRGWGNDPPAQHCHSSFHRQCLNHTYLTHAQQLTFHINNHLQLRMLGQLGRQNLHSSIYRSSFSPSGPTNQQCYREGHTDVRYNSELHLFRSPKFRTIYFGDYYQLQHHAGSYCE